MTTVPVSKNKFKKNLRRRYYLALAAGNETGLPYYIDLGKGYQKDN